MIRILAFTFCIYWMNLSKMAEAFGPPEIEYCSETNCFTLIDSRKTWNYSRAFCERHGGNLAIIRNEEDVRMIQNLLNGKSENKNNPEFPFAWVGINSMKDPGHYVTVLGEDIPYSNWAVGEPNNPYTERCVSIYADGKLNDLNCRLPTTFVCEGYEHKIYL